MKKDIHPPMYKARVKCTCGNTFDTRSTREGDLSLDVCSQCHPFYTGKQKLVDSSGQVEKFRRKFG